MTLSNTSFWADALDTVQLGVPIFVARLSWVGMKTTDSALLGHVSAESLAAAALSDLYAMSTLVLVQGRILSVFVGQAVGANNPRLAGVYLQVSLLVLGVLSLFVILAWIFTAQVWKALGQADEISEMAGYYARVLSSCIPAQVLFVQLSQFFSAQRIMHPEVSASLFAMSLNLSLWSCFCIGHSNPKLSWVRLCCLSHCYKRSIICSSLLLLVCLLLDQEAAFPLLGRMELERGSGTYSCL